MLLEFGEFRGVVDLVDACLYFGPVCRHLLYL
jgi:hypothetical protein